jgi:hypothetical protein
LFTRKGFAVTYERGIMALMAQARTVIKIAVTKKGHGALKALANEYGMKDYIAGGRIYEWFEQQDDIFQRAVLGLLEGLEHDAATAYMKRLGQTKDVGLKRGRNPKKSSPESEQADKAKLPPPPRQP